MIQAWKFRGYTVRIHSNNSQLIFNIIFPFETAPSFTFTVNLYIPTLLFWHWHWLLCSKKGKFLLYDSWFRNAGLIQGETFSLLERLGWSFLELPLISLCSYWQFLSLQFSLNLHSMILWRYWQFDLLQFPCLQYLHVIFLDLLWFCLTCSARSWSNGS